MDTWTRENLAWLAGLFDGEGCIYLRTDAKGERQPRLQVTISMTDEDVIRRAYEVAGVGSVSGPFGPYKGREHEKPVYKWSCSRFEESQAILAAIYPWLGKRRSEKVRTSIASIASMRPVRPYKKSAKLCLMSFRFQATGV